MMLDDPSLAISLKQPQFGCTGPGTNGMDPHLGDPRHRLKNRDCDVAWVLTMALMLTLFIIMLSGVPVALAAKKKPPDRNLPTAFSNSSVATIALDRETKSVLDQSSSTFVWAADGKSAVFDASRGFHFVPPSDDEYSVQYQCDTKLLGMIIFDSVGKVISLPTTFSQVPRVNKVSFHLKKDQEIWIVLGGRKVASSISFRIGIFDHDNRLGPDHNREYSSASLGTKEYNGITSDDHNIRPIKYFQIVRNNTEAWVSVLARSLKVEPYIIVLDSSDNEVTHEVVREQIDASSQVVIGPHTNWASFAVQQFQDDNSTESKISLSISEYPYDPNNKIFTATSYYMRNPVFSFCVGGVLALLIAYGFYRKTFSAKSIYYETERDDSVVNIDKQTDAQNSGLSEVYFNNFDDNVVCCVVSPKVLVVGSWAMVNIAFRRR
jgi:hypothetical protein